MDFWAKNFTIICMEDLTKITTRVNNMGRKSTYCSLLTICSFEVPESNFKLIRTLNVRRIPLLFLSMLFGAHFKVFRSHALDISFHKLILYLASHSPTNLNRH